VGFSERLYKSAAGIWETSHRHPFLEELKKGTLGADKFAFYLCQDYMYLIDYAKLFALGSVKARDLGTMSLFASMLHSTLHVEMDLHRQFSALFGVTAEQLEATEPSPVTLAYTHYMLAAAQNGTLADLVAVLLPCMWSYREIGVRFSAEPGALDHPLYREWILAYAADDFGETADRLIGLMNRLAENLPESELAKLEEHFVNASRFEYMFWDMAYRKAMWPI
jgi:thiaminase/transcriptional activator TenA